MAYKCSDCGAEMVRVLIHLQGKGVVLYECTECDNNMMEYAGTEDEA